MVNKNVSILQWWWRIGLSILGVSILGYVLVIYYAPHGEFSYSYYFNEEPGIISEFGPSGRALTREQNTSNGEFYQRLVGDPIYFSVQLPSPYPEAEVTIEYQNPDDNIVQIGLRLDDDEEAWNYDFKPLENPLVDDSVWDATENDDYILLQKEPTYNSVEEFLETPPTDARVGTFLTSLEFPFIDPTYEPSEEGTEFTTPLRGRHELYTYIKDEDLRFSATYQDINYGAGPDPVKITVYYVGNVSAVQEFADDGDEGISGVSRGERTASVELKDLKEGIYRIVLEANDDIIFTNITSSQHKLVFKGNLHLAGSPEYQNTIPDIVTDSTTVYSNAHFITLLAKHQYGVGSIDFYDGEFVIPKDNAPFQWNNPIPNYFHSFEVPQNDVQLITTGILSVDENSWFDPLFGFEPLTHYASLTNLDYIISKQYTFPERLRSWTIATATFDVSQAYREDPTTLDFILSAPGLEQSPQGLKVRAIHITATKEAVTWDTFWPRVKNRLFGN